MVTNDATILKMKHDVLCEVAKLAWAGELEEKREELPYKMIPLLYLQRTGDYQTESPPGGGSVPCGKRFP